MKDFLHSQWFMVTMALGGLAIGYVVFVTKDGNIVEAAMECLAKVQ